MKASNRLRVLRAERRITQLDLALKARITLNRYWRIENGYLNPTPEERERLARALRASPGEAFPSVEATA